jgi:hypothetical protein
VEIYDSDGVSVKSVEWDPTEGPQQYLLLFGEQGDYEIVVAHVADDVEVSESDTFSLEVMKITVIDIIPGVVGSITIDPGEDTEPTADEIHEGAMAVLAGLYEAMGPVSGGGGELPEGIAVDTSGHDWSQGGGTIIFYMTDYQLPGSAVTMTGEISAEMWWISDVTPNYLDEHITGSVTLSGLAVETFVIDVYLTVDMDDAPIWSTAAWSGTITLDGYEADLDQVMTEFVAMMAG